MLERVQRRETRIIHKLRDISYEMRLKECGLTTHEGHGVTLANKPCILDTRKFSFSQRAINKWNRL